MPMGAAPMAWTLWSRHLKHDPADPTWPDRDRFVLSAGHGSALLYALLHMFGYDLPMSELENFRQLGSKTPGHPEVGHTPGVETTTGPLGQGLAMAVGLALAERMTAARYPEITDHHTYVIVGDGCLMEGVSHEAASLAGHLGLGRLIVMWDDNSITIDGSTDLSTSDDQLARFTAYGWHVVTVDDGTDVEAIDACARRSQGRSTAQLHRGPHRHRTRGTRSRRHLQSARIAARRPDPRRRQDTGRLDVGTVLGARRRCEWSANDSRRTGAAAHAAWRDDFAAFAARAARGCRGVPPDPGSTVADRSRRGPGQDGRGSNSSDSAGITGLPDRAVATAAGTGRRIRGSGGFDGYDDRCGLGDAGRLQRIDRRLRDP